MVQTQQQSALTVKIQASFPVGESLNIIDTGDSP
jgi:hypothetical protein